MALKSVHGRFKATVPLSTVNLCPPNASCGICKDTYTKVQWDPGRVILGELDEEILGNGECEDGRTRRRDVSMYEDKQVLSDPDWDDNERTLERRGACLSPLPTRRGRGGQCVWRCAIFREWFRGEVCACV